MNTLLAHLLRRSLLALAPLALLALVPSCTKAPTTSAYQQYMSYNVDAKRPSNPNNVRVEVSLNNRAAYVMEGDKPLLVMPVGIGKPGQETPKGTFRIRRKDATKRANTHGHFLAGNQIKGYGFRRDQPPGTRFLGTPMPYWVEFKSAAYGFHTGWVHPGPCSAGCLRMHKNVAPKFFALVSQGTPLKVASSSPLDKTIGANIPRPPNPKPFPDYPASKKVNDAFFKDHAPVKFN